MYQTLVPNWISALANSLMVLGVILAVRQLKLVTQQLKISAQQLKLNYLELEADHTRSRREKAIEFGANWVRNHNEKSADAVKLISALSDPDAKLVGNREPVNIDEKLQPILSRVLPETTFHPTEGRIQLTDKQSAELRWLIVSHLNELEVVFSAWLHNVADKEMIEQEFSSTINQIPGDYIAERFRQASGINCWPAIASFVENYRKAHNSAVQGKHPLPSL